MCNINIYEKIRDERYLHLIGPVELTAMKVDARAFVPFFSLDAVDIRRRHFNAGTANLERQYIWDGTDRSYYSYILLFFLFIFFLLYFLNLSI